MVRNDWPVCGEPEHRRQVSKLSQNSYISRVISIPHSTAFHFKRFHDIVFRHKHTATCLGMTRGGFWIDIQIYWALSYSVWPHFTIHYFTCKHAHVCTHSHAHTHTLVSTVMSALAVAWYRLPIADFPFPLDSWTIAGLNYSNSQQTDWFTHSPTARHFIQLK
jgi:hypothetical protein